MVKKITRKTLDEFYGKRCESCFVTVSGGGEEDRDILPSWCARSTTAASDTPMQCSVGSIDRLRPEGLAVPETSTNLTERKNVFSSNRVVPETNSP